MNTLHSLMFRGKTPEELRSLWRQHSRSNDLLVTDWETIQKRGLPKRRDNLNFVLFYPTSREVNSTGGVSEDGHYCCVIQNREKGTNYYYDPYGTLPDDVKHYAESEGLYPHKKNQDLLYRFINSGKKFDYSDYPHQSTETDLDGQPMSTCGLHCISRLLHSHLSNDEYNKVLQKACKVMRQTPDLVVTKSLYSDE